MTCETCGKEIQRDLLLRAIAHLCEDPYETQPCLLSPICNGGSDWLAHEDARDAELKASVSIAKITLENLHDFLLGFSTWKH